MRVFLLAAGIALIAACSPGDTRPASETSEIARSLSAEAPVENPKVKAVLSYATWCPSCKILDPKVAAIKATAGLEGVEYIVLDYSRRDDEIFFAAAEAAGIGTSLRDYFSDGIETGELLLIDADTGAIVRQINKSNTAAEIEAALRELTS